jgi:hypothetical protein
MSKRSIEANKLRADLTASRWLEQALHQARQAYLFNANTYSYECLSAMQRLKRVLAQLPCPVTKNTDTKDANSDDLSVPSPSQSTLPF